MVIRFLNVRSYPASSFLQYVSASKSPGHLSKNIKRSKEMRSDTVQLTAGRNILVLLILVVPSHVTTFNCRRRCKNTVDRLRTASLPQISYSSSFSSTMMMPGKRRAVFSRRNTVRMTNQIITDTSRQTLLC